MAFGRKAWAWATPTLVLAAVGVLAGCGGGGGGPVNPIATPSPSATPIISGVYARLVTLPTPGGGSVPVAEVAWATPAFASAGDVVEYHVFRNNVIVGVVSKKTTAFNDAGAALPFTYFAVSGNDDTKLTSVTASASSAFLSGVPVIYRVTALYVTPDTASSATPVYAEAEIGQSSTITP